MEVVLETVKRQLESGKFTFDLLIPKLQNQLNSVLNQNQPLLSKMMNYYKLIDVSNGTPISDYEILNIIQDKSELIQEGIEVIEFQKFPNVDYTKMYFTPDEVALLEAQICIVKNAKFRGASHPFFLGVIFQCIENFKNEEEIHVSIVHELAHQELFLLNMLDRLVLTSNNPRLIHSPLQGKARPAIGRLHSAHALYRMIQLRDHLSSQNKQIFSRYLNETVETFSSGDLSEFGEFLVTIYKRVL